MSNTRLSYWRRYYFWRTVFFLSHASCSALGPRIAVSIVNDGSCMITINLLHTWHLFQISFSMLRVWYCFVTWRTSLTTLTRICHDQNAKFSKLYLRGLSNQRFSPFRPVHNFLQRWTTTVLNPFLIKLLSDVSSCIATPRPSVINHSCVWFTFRKNWTYLNSCSSQDNGRRA